MTNKYFVWVKGPRGPVPQIWTDEQFVDGKPASFIFKQKLEPYEANLSLDDLAKFYKNEAKE